MKGFILLHRQIMGSFIFQNPYYFKLWSYCIMEAAYEARCVDVEGDVVCLERGQLVWRRQMSAEVLNAGMKPALQKSESGWEYMLRGFEKKGHISRDCRSNCTVVTVLNYAHYQGADHASADEPAAAAGKPGGAQSRPNTAQHPAGDPYVMYEKAFSRPLTEVITQSITEWINDFGGQEELVAYAISLAGKNAAQSPRYVEAVLRTWRLQGIDTLAKATAQTAEYEARKETFLRQRQQQKEDEEKIAHVPELSMHNWLDEPSKKS